MFGIVVGDIFEHKPLFRLKVSNEVHISINVLLSTAKRNPQKKMVEKRFEKFTTAEFKVSEYTFFSFFYGRKGPVRPNHRCLFTNFDRLSLFLGSFTSSMQLCINARAAMFSSYGNQTRPYRFIQVSTASAQKRKDQWHASICMHAGRLRQSQHACRPPASIVGVELLDSVALRFFSGPSCLVSFLSSLLSVAFCFSEEMSLISCFLQAAFSQVHLYGLFLAGIPPT